MTGDIPFIEQHLDQLNKHLSFICINIDNDVDIFLHMCADVADRSNVVNGVHRFAGNTLGRRIAIYGNSKSLYFIG